jgi:predicted transcriptional regulator
MNKKEDGSGTLSPAERRIAYDHFIGEALREQRIEHTQWISMVAKNTAITNTSIARYESGGTSIPMSTLVDICKVNGFDIKAILKSVLSVSDEELVSYIAEKKKFDSEEAKKKKSSSR